MSMYKLLGCALTLPALCGANDELPALGEPLAGHEVDAVVFTVLPDGTGLPDGSGTAEDGRKIYEQQCMACHGASGEGTLNDRLAGGHGSIDSERPVKTVGSYWPYATTLFDYLRRAMPYTAPGSLDNDELYAVTAYVLHLNDIVDENERLDADSLPQVRMPNRDGFDRAWPE